MANISGGGEGLQYCITRGGPAYCSVQVYNLGEGGWEGGEDL